MNDDDCPADQSQGENRSEDEKVGGFSQKILARFIAKIFAADIQE